MPVKKDESGRRSVQAEVEVPGTPEEVWKAIATGPGISSWFVPSEVEEREGGTAVSHFAPGSGMDSVGAITTWEPPRRFVVTTEDMGPGGPPVATEWVVEARSGDTCVVRVVHSWFASTDDWDNQFEGHEQGWLAFFRILRLSLLHFRNQPGAAFQLMVTAPGPTASAWDALVGPLGLSKADVGARIASAAGTPGLSGTVERVGAAEFPELLVRLDEPAPGLAHIFPLPMGGQVFLTVRIYLFGGRAGDAAAREEPVWQKWLHERFTPVHDPGSAAEVTS